MADRPRWETGLAIKLVNWLYKKNSHCKESAVVAPLPADRYFGGVSPSPRYRTGRRIGKRGAEKIIELLGPENRDQQLQIHALLEQSGIDSDSASDDEIDSGSDDNNVEQALSKANGVREAAVGNGSSRLPRPSAPTQFSPQNHHFQGSSQTGSEHSKDGFQARTGVKGASPQLSLLLKLPAEESNRCRDHNTKPASNGMSSCLYSHQTTKHLLGCRQCLPCPAKFSPNHQTSKHSFARAAPSHSPPVTPLHPGFGPLNYQGNHFEHPVTCRNLIYSKHPHTPSCSSPQTSSCGHSVPQRSDEDGVFLKGSGGNQEPPRRSTSSITPSPSQIRQSSILAHSEDRQWTPSQSPFFSPHFSPPKTPHSPHSHQSLCTSPIHSPTRTGLVLGEKLGSGSFGAVYKGKDAQTGQQFALKVLHDDRISPQEVAVLSRLNHHHIVKYFGTATLRDGRFCILLELMKCSLASVLKDSNGLDETMIRVYTRQILCGLEYLHDKQIVHRDIKCGNILLDAKGRAKLADFGVAKKIDLSIAKSCKGTLFYMAPEVLVSANDGQYGLPADIWSLGCTVIEMADGKPPWSGVGMMSFMVKMKEGQCPPIPKGLSRDAVHFIRSCLARKPENRPIASTLLRHPFVTNISDLERL